MLSEKTIVLSVDPSSLFPNAQVPVLVRATSDGLALPGAIIRFKAGVRDFSNPDFTTTTDANGIVRRNISPQSNGSSLYIQAEKVGYLTTDVNVPVRYTLPVSPGQPISCVLVTWNGMDVNAVNFRQGQGQQFLVKNDCANSVTVGVLSELGKNPATLSLGAGASTTVTITANKLLGEYFVRFQGKFSASNPWGLIKEITAYIYRPQLSQPLIEDLGASPFTLSKSAFDFRANSSDNGFFGNTKYVFQSDFSVPKVSTTHSNIVVHYEGETTPSEPFSYTIESVLEGEVQAYDTGSASFSKNYRFNIQGTAMESFLLSLPGGREEKEDLYLNGTQIFNDPRDCSAGHSRSALDIVPDRDISQSMGDYANAIRMAVCATSTTATSRGSFLISFRSAPPNNSATVSGTISTDGSEQPVGALSADNSMVLLNGQDLNAPIIATQDLGNGGTIRFTKIKYVVRSSNPNVEVWFDTGGTETDSNNANVLAKYVGTEYDYGGQVDFSLTNAGVVGTDYAELKIEDTVDGFPPAASSQSFHVRLDGLDGNTCAIATPSEIKFGVTGPNALPPTRLDWSYSALDANILCDSTNPDGVYCDSAQFSIETIKRLEAYQKKIESDDFSGAQSLKQFTVLMMKDGFSQDFREDFDSYAQNTSFLDVMPFYNDSPNGFKKIFSDPSRFSWDINGRTSISVPGKYSVVLELDYDDPAQLVFVENGVPRAHIVVRMQLIEAAKQPSPLLFMPFDGVLGKKRDISVIDNSEDGIPPDDSSYIYHRIGYGTAFSGAVVTIASDPFVQTLDSPNPQVSVKMDEQFESLNETNRGTVLVLKQNEIVYAPSIATPVLMEARSNAGVARSFYAVRKNGVLINGGDSMGIWTGVASNIGGSVCQSFDRNPLPFTESDRAALSYNDPGASSCAFTGTALGGLYGFDWTNTSEFDNQSIYLESYFFTPRNDNGYELQLAQCAGSSLISGGGANVEPNGTLGLSDISLFPTVELDSIQDLLQNVRDGSMCASVSPEKVELFWNPKFLHQKMASHYPTAVTQYVCSTVESIR